MVGAVLVDVVRGTWSMGRIMLGPRPGERQGEVEVALGERTDGGARVSALLASMSPGSLLLGIDWERRVMRFHLADASRAERFREDMERFYRERQRAVFP
jgi:multicomponent K+:H+ antiporter subunit E/multicomponent Na+:H+ antiporter subunit E